MDDLVSRQAVMKEFSDFVRRANNSDFAKTPTWNDAVSLVGSLPSAEVTLCHLDSPCEYQNADIAMPSAQQWIPVSERLPEEGVQVLVTDDAGGLATIDVDCGYFDEEYGRFEWFHSQNVTAWMPLPEPYAERREGNGRFNQQTGGD